MANQNDTDDSTGDLEYQSGKQEVHARNLDAAGDGHPLGQDPLSFQANLQSLIRRVADDIYSSWEATIREYLANAETACLRTEQFVEEGDIDMFDDVDSLYGVDNGYDPRIEVTYRRSEDRVEVRDNGLGMSSDLVETVFRHIGRSTNRDQGQYSGQFGQGVLSFAQLIGADNSMIMKTHSRRTDENFSCLVTLAGPEPIRGSMPENEYGTEFQMTPDDDYDIRAAVERYAEWMRVPVIYREFDEDGVECYNEDWGDKTFVDEYDDEVVTFELSEPDAFSAYCSHDANGDTLLLSMPIERNDESRGGKHGAPFQFDVRLLDESGKVVKSTNGNEGLMPVPRSDYEDMLKQARDPYITEDLLSGGDVVGQEVAAGPNEGAIALSDDPDNYSALPAGNEYLVADELESGDEPGELRVIFGPHEGKLVVEEDEWAEMDDGRADLYVPEDELESWDVDDETGDLCLPEPTSDRDRLQQNDEFWEWLGSEFKKMFEDEARRVFEKVENADDPVAAIIEMEPEDLIVEAESV